MSRSRCHNLWLAALLAAGPLLPGWAFDRVPTNSPPVPLVRTNAARRVLPPMAVNLPFPGKSPVELFRELLAMDAFERIKFLANRSPESRKLIMAKVREYQSFKPDERELRLQITELRWYLWPLMHASGTNRAAQLQRIPAPQRQLVEDRLREWDKLSSQAQKELLDNEAAIRHFSELSTSSGQQRTNILNSISPARRAMLERGVQQWQQLPEARRQEMTARFNQFFELTVEEKERAFRTLSEPERRQLEKTLSKFDHLTPAQRARCIQSFAKFASLSLAERQEFLKNAERWKLMTPKERQDWKELVAKLSPQPPVPPISPRPPLPSIPHLLRTNRPAAPALPNRS